MLISMLCMNLVNELIFIKNIVNVRQHHINMLILCHFIILSIQLISPCSSSLKKRRCLYMSGFVGGGCGFGGGFALIIVLFILLIIIGCSCGGGAFF